MLWGDTDTIKDPAGTTYDASKQTPYSVISQLDDENSLYNYYKKVILLRKANPEIAAGDYTALVFSDTKLGGFICTLDGSSVCVLHNSTAKPITVDISNVIEMAFTEITACIGANGAEMNGTAITVGAQTSVLLR